MAKIIFIVIAILITTGCIYQGKPSKKTNLEQKTIYKDALEITKAIKEKNLKIFKNEPNKEKIDWSATNNEIDKKDAYVITSNTIKPTERYSYQKNIGQFLEENSIKAFTAATGMSKQILYYKNEKVACLTEDGANNNGGYIKVGCFDIK